MFRRALLPIDGSEVALAAVEPAVRAVAPDGEIVIVAVIPTRQQLSAATAHAGARGRSIRTALDFSGLSYDARRAEAEESLVIAAERVRAAGDAVARTVVDEGEPGPTIVRVAEQLDCDLIVMSTNGRSGWRRAILGSVSHHVARHSEHVPVLLVPEPPTD